MSACKQAAVCRAGMNQASQKQWREEHMYAGKQQDSRGQIFGRLSYFSQIIPVDVLGNLQHGDGFDGYRELRELASRAGGASNSMYDDGQRFRKEAPDCNSRMQTEESLQNSVRSLDDVRRRGRRLWKPVQRLREPSGSVRAEAALRFGHRNELQAAATKIKVPTGHIPAPKRETLVERAANWGLDWPADGDDRKTRFGERKL